MRTAFGCLSISVWVILFAQPLRAQDAAQLLSRVVETYKHLASYHFESESEGGLITDWTKSWNRAHAILAIESGNRVRFETVDQVGRYVVVSDGKTLWRAIGSTHEYSRTPLTRPVLEVTGAGSEGQLALRRLKMAIERYWSLQENLLSSQLLRVEHMEVDGADVLCRVVRADYAAPHGAEGIHSMTRTFWIDDVRNLIVQEESVTTGNLMANMPYEYAESRHRTRYTRMITGEPLSDALFAYTPPGNYREMDKLESVMQSRRQESKAIVGKPAPEFAAATLNGGALLRLADLRGRPVLLDFWATWCAPCREQMPAIAALYREAKGKGLVLIGVNDDETPEEAVAYLGERQYDWPTVYDHKDGALHREFKVFAIPTLVLIDKDGIVAEYQTGFGPDAEKAIGAALRKLGLDIP